MFTFSWEGYYLTLNGKFVNSYYICRYAIDVYWKEILDVCLPAIQVLVLDLAITSGGLKSQIINVNSITHIIKEGTVEPRETKDHALGKQFPC